MGVGAGGHLLMVPAQSQACVGIQCDPQLMNTTDKSHNSTKQKWCVCELLNTANFSCVRAVRGKCMVWFNNRSNITAYSPDKP